MFMKPDIQKIKQETSQIQVEVKEKLVGYIVAAFGLVAGLAWNEAIKALIEKLFPVDNSGLLAKFIYAILISLFVVIISMYLVRLTKRKTDESK